MRARERKSLGSVKICCSRAEYASGEVGVVEVEVGRCVVPVTFRLVLSGVSADNIRPKSKHVGISVRPAKSNFALEVTINIVQLRTKLNSAHVVEQVFTD